MSNTRSALGMKFMQQCNIRTTASSKNELNVLIDAHSRFPFNPIKWTLTGRFWWWPFPCQVYGIFPRVPCPRGLPWDHPRHRLPQDDEEVRGDGEALRGGDAVPEGVARCATSPGVREAWVASSQAHQDHPDDDGATLPPRPPGQLLLRAYVGLSLNLKQDFSS